MDVRDNPRGLIYALFGWTSRVVVWFGLGYWLVEGSLNLCLYVYLSPCGGGLKI